MDGKEKRSGSKSIPKINLLKKQERRNNWGSLISSTNKIISYLKENGGEKKEDKKAERGSDGERNR